MLTIGNVWFTVAAVNVAPPASAGDGDVALDGPAPLMLRKGRGPGGPVRRGTVRRKVFVRSGLARPGEVRGARRE